ncbi:uncharacterized protein CDAR_430211 [Caerostris darwini]|uniref:Uncharacterized protein n=1 Tax=Caerostris darwini TaxID=1538125 RepID=A0AAV4TMA0_9ARAC|nr:uncharacterized protein CDAR_430211 [Caerostris darwini]
MQWIVLFLCFGLLLVCSSQDITETDAQVSTERTSTGTQAIDWDTTDSTSKTTAYGGRRGRFTQTPRTPSPSDYTTLFPNNQWGPMMMPMVQPPRFGTRIQNVPARERPQDTYDFRPYFRRPDAIPENVTEKADQYPTPSDAVKYPLNLPYLPYPPMFYPRQIPSDFSEYMLYSIPNNSANDVHPYTLQDLNEKQNISASSPPPFYYGLPNGRLDDRIPFPFMRYPNPAFFPRHRADDRNPDPNLAPFSPYAMPFGFYPPPPPPTVPTDDGGSYPQIDVFVRPPYVDREPGFESPVPREVLPPSDSSYDPEDVPPPTIPPVPADSLPAESVPRSQLPIAPFPFRLLPPGLVPPFPFPIPQGDIPPPTLPPRLIPNAPLPSDIPLPPSPLPALSPVPPPAVQVDRLPENIPPPIPAGELPPLKYQEFYHRHLHLLLPVNQL